MINIAEIVATWPEVNGWKVAPAGALWIQEGYRIKVGDNVRIGNSVIGNYVEIGNGVVIGNYAKIGNYIEIGNNTRIGNYVEIGNNTRIGNYVEIGNNTRIGNYVVIVERSKLGDNCVDFVSLGFCDGYAKGVGVTKDGTVYFSGGCKWLTLAEATEHCKDRKDLTITKILINTAKEIAVAKGWVK